VRIIFRKITEQRYVLLRHTIAVLVSLVFATAMLMLTAKLGWSNIPVTPTLLILGSLGSLMLGLIYLLIRPWSVKYYLVAQQLRSTPEQYLVKHPTPGILRYSGEATSRSRLSFATFLAITLIAYVYVRERPDIYLCVVFVFLIVCSMLDYILIRARIIYNQYGTIALELQEIVTLLLKQRRSDKGGGNRFTFDEDEEAKSPSSEQLDKRIGAHQWS
jgi:hypothetical protein